VSTSISYEQAVRAIRAPLQSDAGRTELVRYATLAANSHNSQPWRFAIAEHHIVIAPDPARRCPVVDPDDHHLYISLGCAVENLVHAAAAIGLKAVPTSVADAVHVVLEAMPPERTPLFEAIPRRQSTRAVYDGRPVANEALRLLERAGTGQGVSVLIITDRARIASITDCVIQANSVQMRDKAHLGELRGWLRFNDKEAVATMDGLFARAFSKPTVPTWLGRLVLPLVFTETGENAKYRAHIESSAGMAVFVAELNDKAHLIEVGRACERFALQATALGLKYAHLNQPVEVPMLRRQFASYLAIGARLPDLVVRFGTGPELPSSLRRPVEQVVHSVRGSALPSAVGGT